MAKKYSKGTLASEEHRYDDAQKCHDDAQTSFNADYPLPLGGEKKEPPQIEWPMPPGQPQTTTTIYSWRGTGKNQDVEMRFIVMPGLAKYPEVFPYHRVEKDPKGNYHDDRTDLDEAIGEDELGAGSDPNRNECAKQDTSPVAPGKALIWRAIVRYSHEAEKTGDNFTPPDTGLTTNPPYPP